jgi:16S rRNA (guanine1207-N2)-methyltransferase
MSSLLLPRPAEQCALEIAQSLAGKRILCTTLGRAQAASHFANQRPTAHVACWFLDQFQQLLTGQEVHADNLTLLCQPDFPREDFDLAVLPFSMRGEAELTRDLLQTAADRLIIGGKLVAATDNPKDDWLRLQLAALFKKVTRHAFDNAVVYVVTKQAPLKKLKDFRAEFVFRDGERLIRAVSRPGVFSHRHIDPGARHLIDAAEVRPGMRMLDIGCGAGTVSLALAARQSTAEMLAVDSNARCVECTRMGAELNGLTNVTTLLSATGDYPDEGTFDLAVANPPYYGDHEIAARFVAAARRSLKPGGQLLLVTKSPNWYEEYLAVDWREVLVTPSKRYWVVSANS